jgi:hypothetical protein
MGLRFIGWKRESLQRTELKQAAISRAALLAEMQILYTLRLCGGDSQYFPPVMGSVAKSDK